MLGKGQKTCKLWCSLKTAFYSDAKTKFNMAFILSIKLFKALMAVWLVVLLLECTCSERKKKLN